MLISFLYTLPLFILAVFGTFYVSELGFHAGAAEQSSFIAARSHFIQEDIQKNTQLLQKMNFPFVKGFVLNQSYSVIQLSHDSNTAVLRAEIPPPSWIPLQQAFLQLPTTFKTRCSVWSSLCGITPIPIDR